MSYEPVTGWLLRLIQTLEQKLGRSVTITDIKKKYRRRVQAQIYDHS